MFDSVDDGMITMRQEAADVCRTFGKEHAADAEETCMPHATDTDEESRRQEATDQARSHAS